MKRILAAGVPLIGTALPAQATEWVDCSGAKGGTLHMPGIGAWAVSCSGP